MQYHLAKHVWRDLQYRPAIIQRQDLQYHYDESRDLYYRLRLALLNNSIGAELSINVKSYLMGFAFTRRVLTNVRKILRACLEGYRETKRSCVSCKFA